jgi:isocitrate/isopropylmalate dehydrogenase
VVVVVASVHRRGDRKTGDLGGKAMTTEFTDAVCRALTT